jgi:hypothetical protein
VNRTVLNQGRGLSGDDDASAGVGDSDMHHLRSLGSVRCRILLIFLKPHFTPRALGILFFVDGAAAFLHLSRVESSIEDLRVRTAAAQISCDRLLYIVQIRIRVPFE